MRIFCFGDSNTYGYDARSMLGERLGANERWPEILGKISGWEVVNEGMNGREIPESPWFLERFDHLLSACAPVDLLFLMLGSNDLLNSYCPDIENIGSRMEKFVKHVLKHPAVDGRGKKIILAAPPPVEIGCYGEEYVCYDRESHKFGACYGTIAKQYGLRFADTAGWELPLAHDGVHLTPEGHMRFADQVWMMMQKFV